MTEPAEKPEYPPGIPCPKCGGTEWAVTCTRAGPRRVRRWRKCVACGNVVRTAEVIESESVRPRKALA